MNHEEEANEKTSNGILNPGEMTADTHAGLAPSCSCILEPMAKAALRARYPRKAALPGRRRVRVFGRLGEDTRWALVAYKISAPKRELIATVDLEK